MGNNINTARKFFKKPTIQNSSKGGEDIMTYFENIKKTVESQTNAQNSSSQFFRKFMPSSFSQFKIMSNHKLKKVDSYIKSPSYLQKYKLLKLKAQNVFEKFNSNSESKDLNLKEKIFALKNPFNLARDLTRKKFRRIGMYFGLFLIVYTLWKYVKYRLYHRVEDSNLTEVLKLVNDLRKQNEELIKQNKELVDKILKGK
jgi:hypothetical protein